jgi:hypothetical protein
MLHQNETPVTAAEEATLTSHLKNVVLPGAAEAEEAGEISDAVEAISDVKLPKSIAATITMIRDRQAIQPKSKKEAAVKEASLFRLRAHLHALSQGPTAPRIDYKAFFERHVPASALAFVEASYPKTKARKA